MLRFNGIDSAEETYFEMVKNKKKATVSEESVENLPNAGSTVAQNPSATPKSKVWQPSTSALIICRNKYVYRVSSVSIEYRF